MSVFVIAEVGVNHNGSLETALKLMEAAYRMGADAIKFQAFYADTLEPPGARRNMLKFLELKPSDFCHLRDRCAELGLEFMATPFDVEWLRFLYHEMGMRLLKLSSSAIFDPVLRASAATLEWERVFLSTGCSEPADLYSYYAEFKHGITPDYLRSAPSSFERERQKNAVTLLHCVSAYPTLLKDCQLASITALKSLYPNVGFSSHCPSAVPAITAVALGAEVIEQHITFDRNAKGPDHLSSMEVLAFGDMVKAVKSVKSVIGTAKTGPSNCEDATLRVIRERNAWRDSF